VEDAEAPAIKRSNELVQTRVPLEVPDTTMTIPAEFISIPEASSEVPEIPFTSNWRDPTQRTTRGKCL
jgi:hypothetical protein